MKHLVSDAGLSEQILVDSSGTGAYHVGERPDRRSRAVARTRGITVDGAARRFEMSDFDDFEYVIAMDTANLRDLRLLAKGTEHQRKVQLLLTYDPKRGKESSVPDPYYEGTEGFEQVLDLVTEGCNHLLDHICEEHGLKRRAGKGPG